MAFSLKGYRTVILNASVAVASAITIYMTVDGMLGGAVSVMWPGSLFALSTTNLLLRYLSDTPIFSSEPTASWIPHN